MIIDLNNPQDYVTMNDIRNKIASEVMRQIPMNLGCKGLQRGFQIYISLLEITEPLMV